MHAAAAVQQGSPVWVRVPAPATPAGAAPPPDWAAAIVQSVGDGGRVTARTEDGRDIAVGPADYELRADETGVQDLIRLVHMNEPSVLDTLAKRYAAGDIYTRTGNGIVIAINPFRPVPHLYDAAAMESHRTEGSSTDDGTPRAPHVFSVASQAYWRMRQEGKGQALLVTGESGAGKTETSKLIMKYLAYLGGYKQAASDDDDARPSVEQRVLESNPLLEAFGNAKTVRNDNSSRFGKYIELHFCPAGSMSGARIYTYLLERSRLVAPSKNERNYHIFYQLLAGATPEERARWHLGCDAGAHRLTSAGGCLALPGVDDAADFAVTRHAMRSVGLGAADQENIFRLLAALLHLADADFDPCPKSDGEGCVLSDASGAALASAAALLGCDAAALAKALTTRTRQTPDGPIVSPLPAKAAAETRDALSKVIYARLFDWLVNRINLAIGEDLSCASTIGLLDIYGFESFAFNDLEQFCINLANEKLQQHFNHHVFKQQQEEYEREGIDWSYIEFIDNQDVLDLMEGRMGLMDLIDETCRFPTATPRDLADRLLSGAVPAASGRFSRAKKSATAFTISHYAGPVTYQTDNMLDKNRDFVIAEHQALLGASDCELARALFPSESDGGAASAAPAAGKGSSSNLKGFQFVSVGSQFKRQLAELASKLSKLQPHYVRCIKPNPRNAPMQLDAAYSLEQLRCGGIMEAVRISNAGYPLRRPFGEFLDAFWPLCPSLWGPRLKRRRAAAAVAGPEAVAAARDEDRAAALALLRGLGADPEVRLREGHDWQIGHTMVFMRSGAAAALARLHVRMQGAAAVRLQAGWRGALARREAARRRAAIVKVQAFARGAAARREARARREERAAAVLQGAWRSRVARRALARKRAAARALKMALQSAGPPPELPHVKLARRVTADCSAPAGWHKRAGGAAAAMLRAVASLGGGGGSSPSTPARDSKAKQPMHRYKAAARIQAAWRGGARMQHEHYREEHALAAAVIQQLWRERARLRSDALAGRLRSALINYAVMVDSTIRIQAAWRGHTARRAARALREDKRKAIFRKNAAMFESMAAAGGKLPMPSPLQAAFAILATSSAKPRGEDVVKSDSVSSLGKGELLDHRGIGELRDRAKVTSLLGIWQHRLQFSRARHQQAKERQNRVWRRQQEEMLKANSSARADADASASSSDEPDSPLSLGPPMLF